MKILAALLFFLLALGLVFVLVLRDGEGETGLEGAERPAPGAEELGPRRAEHRPRDYERLAGEADEAAAEADEVAEDGAAEDEAAVFRITGRVVDDLGAPLEGAVVSCDLPAISPGIAGSVEDDGTTPRYLAQTDAEGRFELRFRTAMAAIGLTASKEGHRDRALRTEVPRRDLEIVLGRKAVIRGRLVALPGSTLAGLVPEIRPAHLREGWERTAAVELEDDGRFEFGIPPGSWDLLVRDPWSNTVLERFDLRVVDGDVLDLGDLVLASSVIVLQLRLDFPEELRGRSGELEAVAPDGDERFAAIPVALYHPDIVHRLLVPTLPVDLRCLIDGVRLHRFRLDRRAALLALEPGIARDLILDFAGVLDPGCELQVALEGLELGCGDQATFRDPGAAAAVELPEYASYKVALSCRRTEQGSFVAEFEIDDGLEPAVIDVRPEDTGPLRLRLSAKAIHFLREEKRFLR